MFCIGFNTKPRFRVSLDHGPRGYRARVAKRGLPFDIAAEFYTSSTGAQIDLQLGPLGLLLYVFWPYRPYYYGGIGYTFRLGPKSYRACYHWPRKPRIGVKTTK